MNFNELPKTGKIYFVGIGGISMSALAMILKNKGFDVCGYDKTASEITFGLEKNGIEIFYQTEDKNLNGVSCTVYSAAFTPEHPEIQQIAKRNIPLYKRAQLLGAIAKLYPNSIGIAGTHGKSTTSGMLSYVFMNDKKYDPTVLVGAVLPNISSTFKLGSDENFIFEADEYKDSFLSFFPRIAVILNVKLDHTDYFPSFERLIQSFKGFVSNTGNSGYAVINHDSEGAIKAVSDYAGKLITFSSHGNRKATFYAENIIMNKGFATFDVYKSRAYYMSVTLSVPGLHNVSNALSVVACCDICGMNKESISSGIKSFKGVCRRFEFKGQFMGADVFDDYAHHPDEIRATLSAAKNMDYKRVISVFQPHTYSRLRDLFDDFAASFSDCDLPVFADIYSAREVNTYGITSEQLAVKVKSGIYLDSFLKIEEYLKCILCPGDLLIFMGAGNITELAKTVTKE
ncbi:MAG TPA: UDP-N-acetylmuramate--L-alanine ligase [Clostridiales bacterium]|nr:UDP-N-acetylmuramate--L-alanine ligase [Clostridiales bacterium]